MNVGKDQEKLEEMLSYSGGKRAVPVIVEEGRVRIGFAGNSSLPRELPLFGGT